ncbi:MAG: phosphoribosylformylglycinamidine synthase subunit PurS, partial [Planctomycetota bacterium]
MSPTAEAMPASSTLSELPPDAWRVEVHRGPERDDPAGTAALSVLAELGVDSVAGVRVGHGYLLPPSYSEAEVRAIAAELLADPVVNQARLAAPGEALETPSGHHRIVVLPRPGVMDPVAQTVQRLLERTGRTPAAGSPPVATYRAYELEGSPSAEELELAATRLFANETVEVVRIDRDDLPYGVTLPAHPRGRVETPLLDAGDEELQRISAEGVLSLTLEEMQAIQAHFRELGREPSACELETLAQTWSEHCKHKTLTGVIEFEEPGRDPER